MKLEQTINNIYCLFKLEQTIYRIASAKFWPGKTLANQSFQSFGEGKCWRIYNSLHCYCSESGIWLGKILANDVPFAKSAKVSPAKIFRYMVYYICSNFKLTVSYYRCLYPLYHVWVVHANVTKIRLNPLE